VQGRVFSTGSHAAFFLLFCSSGLPRIASIR
jgi:hypothetical protein